MKDLFTAEEFMIDNQMYPYPAEAAEIANNKLRKLFEEAPVVHSRVIPLADNKLHDWRLICEGKDTHRARLMFIEWIKKKCVKHEPIAVGPWFDEEKDAHRCKHCGVELVAEWMEMRGN